MLFNSFEFIFAFLPVAFFVYFFLNKKKLLIASKAWLVFMSLFFYSWWNIVFLPLIVLSVIFNYAIALIIGNENILIRKLFSKKTILLIGIVFNIGLLSYFKYADFFISNINSFIDTDIGLFRLALPLAISFFTLQQVAFLVDSYEGLTKEKSFLNYSLFVLFFPQLIAGPIVHHKQTIPQFSNLKNKVINFNNISIGLFIFSVGLFKKVFFADTFAIWATEGFDSAEVLNLFEAWLTSLSYTFQIYFDFSGYSDMAIGAALLFNIKLPINFNSPYKARGMIDYWKRWHMTLTSFITTYIYAPIIRSFKKPSFNKAMGVTIITFFIAGLWHGASWMFVMFGVLNGIGIVINHYWKKKIKIKMNGVLAWIITFNYVNITLIFFRANEWDDAIKVLSSMFTFDNIVLPFFWESHLWFLKNYVVFGNFLKSINGDISVFIYMFISLFIVLQLKNMHEFKFKSTRVNLIFFTLLTIISLMKLNELSEFIYFEF